MDLNGFVLSGNLTRNVELQKSKDGKSQFAHFTLANDRYAKGKEKTGFFHCTLFNKPAQTLVKYTRKGDKLGIQGHIQYDSYKTKHGDTVETCEFLVENFDFEGSKSRSPEDNKKTAERVNNVDKIPDKDMPF